MPIGMIYVLFRTLVFSDPTKGGLISNGLFLLPIRSGQDYIRWINYKLELFTKQSFYRKELTRHVKTETS